MRGPSGSLWFPADRGCLRNHGETDSSGVFVAERIIDAAVPQLLVTFDASGVDAEQDRDAVTRSPGDLGSGNPALSCNVTPLCRRS